MYRLKLEAIFRPMYIDVEWTARVLFHGRFSHISALILTIYKLPVTNSSDLCTTSSSSFYWASVANALNVLQPYWLIVLPLDVPDLTASLLL